MKNPFYLTLIAAVPFAACVAGGLGFPQPGEVAAKTIRSDFKAPPPGYGEVPFWWWSGREPLNKERLLEQIEEIHKAGIAGVQVNYSHYRSGAWPTQDSTPALFTDDISLSNYTLDFPDAENLWRKLKISTPEMYATELSYVNGKIGSAHVQPAPSRIGQARGGALLQSVHGEGSGASARRPQLLLPG